MQRGFYTDTFICKSSFNGTWLHELDFFFKNVEYTKVVAAAYRCSNLVDECGFCVKQAEDRISTANFPEAVASSMVAFIENEISVLNLHGHWEFH